MLGIYSNCSQFNSLRALQFLNLDKNQSLDIIQRHVAEFKLSTFLESNVYKLF